MDQDENIKWIVISIVEFFFIALVYFIKLNEKNKAMENEKKTKDEKEIKDKCTSRESQSTDPPGQGPVEPDPD